MNTSSPVTVDELLTELEGIIHFADGFGCYYSDGPAGKALREWINGARSVVARAKPSSDGDGKHRNPS